jgi:hypothetical protein
MADNQATRARVLNATVCAKKLADKNDVTPVKNNEDNDDKDNDDDNSPEIKEFWDSAKENVFKLADEYKDSIINENKLVFTLAFLIKCNCSGVIANWCKH